MPESLTRATAGLSIERPVKVLQFGEGNFLRAFTDWMIDIMNEKTDFNSFVTIVQPLPTGMGSVLNAQDGLYHVLLQGIENEKPISTTRLITCVDRVVNPSESYDAFLSLGENQELQFIISNTTEAGITFDGADQNPESLPSTFPGKLTALLYRRYEHFSGSATHGVTMLPCELIDRNGENLRDAVLRYADHWRLENGFRSWIFEHNTFCNTLVDRIVPGFPANRIREIQNSIGYDDKLVVAGEIFHLWVIEGGSDLQKRFPAASASLQVKIVDDLQPYRTRKVRILNGAHTTMVPYALLRGLTTVQEAVEHPEVGEFIRRAVYEEIIPTLELEHSELLAFADDVMARFRNPYIRHELSSIALNSVSKFKVRVLPSILEYIRVKGAFPELLVESLSCLIIFYRGHWKGNALPVNDVAPVTNFFAAAWASGGPDLARRVLSNTELWGTDLTAIPGLADLVREKIGSTLALEKGLRVTPL